MIRVLVLFALNLLKIVSNYIKIDNHCYLENEN